MSNIFDVADVEEKLGVCFADKSLLRTAFTHSSYANEKKVPSNENLEFLGDSILNFTVAEYLFTRYSKLDEGDLSQTRAAMVSERPLYEAVCRLGIGEHVYLSCGEAKSHAGRETIYADLFEAVAAAIYLDSGLESAKKFILSALKESLEGKTPVQAAFADCKTRLQEYVQRTRGSQLRYELLERRGPDHNPEFVFAVFVNDRILGQGSGRSKRDAQQAAASAALKTLNIIR